MQHDIKTLSHNALVAFLVGIFSWWFLRVLIAIVCVICCCREATASPRFVVPEMTLRRGLTDAQYEYLWSMGRNPRIDQATARNWIFTSSRYSNVTNWLNIVGETNDFARLAYTLQQQVFDLTETNQTLLVSNAVLRSECIALTRSLERTYTAYTNQVVETATYSNLFVQAEAELEDARQTIGEEISFLMWFKGRLEQCMRQYPDIEPVWRELIGYVEERIEELRRR